MGIKENADVTAAPSSHFVNGAKPDIGNLVQRKKLEWKTTPLPKPKQPGITFWNGSRIKMRQDPK